jgi:VanZ family protein
MGGQEKVVRRVLLAWAPALLYMILIWLLSSLPNLEVPLEKLPWRDKGVHFVEFAVLGALVAHAVKGSQPGLADGMAWMVGLVLTCVWAVVDEIHQAFVPGRTADVADVAADALGALLGVSAWYLWQLWRQGQRARRGDVGTPLEPGERPSAGSNPDVLR